MDLVHSSKCCYAPTLKPTFLRSSWMRFASPEDDVLLLIVIRYLPVCPFEEQGG